MRPIGVAEERWLDVLDDRRAYAGRGRELGAPQLAVPAPQRLEPLSQRDAVDGACSGDTFEQ
jgi:hypothetical protein